MKRVLKITATNGGTTAKVRIEVVSQEDRYPLKRRQLSRRVLHTIASAVMHALSQGEYFRVPLSQQQIGR